MNTLAPINFHMLVLDTVVAYAHSGICDVLHQPTKWSQMVRYCPARSFQMHHIPIDVWFAFFLIAIPAAVRVLNTPSTAFEPAFAREQVKLANHRVGGNVKRLVTRRDFHHTNWLRRGSFKHIH